MSATEDKEMKQEVPVANPEENNKPEDKPAEADDKPKRERPPPAKAGKIIIRNLGWDLREKHLTGVFKKYGPIESVNVPLNPSNNQNRGFGFVEFTNKEDATSAVKEMHNAKYKGRPLTVEFSLPKATYEKKVQSIVENTNMDKANVIKPISVRKPEEESKEKAKEEAKKIEDAKPVRFKKETLKEKRVRKAKEVDVEAKKPTPKDLERETREAGQATLFVRNIGWDTNQ